MDEKALIAKAIGQVGDGRSRIKMYGLDNKNTLTKEQWISKLKKSNGKCHHCGENVGMENLTIDHIKQIVMGGAHSIENVVPSCKKCNFTKRKEKQTVGRKKLFINSTAFSYDEAGERALGEIVEYLSAKMPWSSIKQSDAIRYAIKIAAINIRQEQKHQAPK